MEHTDLDETRQFDWPADMPAPEIGDFLEYLREDPPPLLIDAADALEREPAAWNQFVSLRQWQRDTTAHRTAFLIAMANEVLSAMKGTGDPYETHFQIALAYVDGLMRRNRGFNHLWVDQSREASERRENAFLSSPDKETLRIFVEALAQASRDFLSAFLRSRIGDAVILHRSFGITEAMRMMLPPMSELSVETLQRLLAHRALSSWATDLSVAAKWSTPTGNRLVVSARVPVDCIWFAPGYGEAELLVSPCRPFPRERPVVAELQIVSFAYGPRNSELKFISAGERLTPDATVRVEDDLSRWEHLKRAFRR